MEGGGAPAGQVMTAPSEMDLEHKAIERIKIASEMSLYHYGQPLVCTYSGGKDSDVMLELFKRSGILFEVHNNHTTADAPQTVYHIRKRFRKLEEKGIKASVEMPKYKGKHVSMWTLIPQKLMPPTRIARYCCSVIKETGCRNRYIATGVRWDESSQRKDRAEFEKIGSKKADKEKFGDEIMLMNDNSGLRRMTELCMQKNKMVVNPIIDWTNTDVWEYIDQEHIKTCELYQCGYTRVGCIGCPAANKMRWKEFADFPEYRLLYIHAFDRMLEERKRRGKDSEWKSGEEVFLWWMEDKNIEGQMSLDEFIDYD